MEARKNNKTKETKNLHTHGKETETWIDHKVSDTRKVVRNIMVVYADSTR